MKKSATDPLGDKNVASSNSSGPSSQSMQTPERAVRFQRGTVHSAVQSPARPEPSTSTIISARGEPEPPGLPQLSQLHIQAHAAPPKQCSPLKFPAQRAGPAGLKGPAAECVCAHAHAYAQALTAAHTGGLDTLSQGDGEGELEDVDTFQVPCSLPGDEDYDSERERAILTLRFMLYHSSLVAINTPMVSNGPFNYRGF